MKRPILTLLCLSLCIFCTNAQDSLLWKFASRSAIYSSPVIDGGIIYFGSNDSNFYALDKNTGAQKWSYKTKGQIKSQPCIYQETVIFNSSDGLIYAFEKNNGKPAWKFKTKAEKNL